MTDTTEALIARLEDFVEADALDDAIIKLRKQQREIAQHEADMKAAAGELVVVCPEPGTDAARLLSANRLLLAEVERLTAERSCAVQGHNGRPYCASCGHVFPASLDGVESVTCGACGTIYRVPPPAPDLRTIDIVFDDADRFLEVASDGRSIKVGEWIERADGYWVLRLDAALPERRGRSHDG